VLRAQAQTKTYIYWKDQITRSFQNIALIGLQVTYACKNQNNAQMSSEIFRRHAFNEFLHYLTYSVNRPPVGPI